MVPLYPGRELKSRAPDFPPLIDHEIGVSRRLLDPDIVVAPPVHRCLPMDRPESRSAEVHRAAAILAAMGDPTRLTILMCLASEGLRVKDFCDIFGGSQANVSRHLKRLVAVGLVVGRRAGREIHYRVADPRVQVIVATAMALAATDNDPEDARVSSPTPILDLLREHSHAITSLRKAVEAIQRRRLRTPGSARRRSRPQRRAEGRLRY